MPFYTPLRYPGGKRRLVPAVTRLLEQNDLRDIEYVEPYAGGASLALSLLFEEYASVIHINDLSRPVYGFWESVLNKTQELCECIERTSVTMTEWERQRAVYDSRETADLFELGFAALFLNRTNRSGIIGGGVIGGKNQTGAWTVDARFTKAELIQRIKKISRYKSRIRLYNRDALELTNNLLPTLGPSAFVFYDPPYIEKGKDLYLDEYTLEGHRALEAKVTTLENPWVVTYDYDAAVRNGLYPSCHRLGYHLAYSAQERYSGKEVMFVSGRLNLPEVWRIASPFNMASEHSEHPFFGVVETMKEEDPSHPEMEEGPEAGARFGKALKTVLTVPKSAVPNPFKKAKVKKKKTR